MLGLKHVKRRKKGTFGNFAPASRVTISPTKAKAAPDDFVPIQTQMINTPAPVNPNRMVPAQTSIITPPPPAPALVPMPPTPPPPTPLPLQPDTRLMNPVLAKDPEYVDQSPALINPEKEVIIEPPPDENILLETEEVMPLPEKQKTNSGPILLLGFMAAAFFLLSDKRR